MINAVLVASMWVLLAITLTVLVVDVDGLLRKKEALSNKVEQLLKEIDYLQYELASAIALRDEALRRYADTRQTLVSIATLNDNDTYFKVWAKKMAQESIIRTTHSIKN